MPDASGGGFYGKWNWLIGNWQYIEKLSMGLTSEVCLRFHLKPIRRTMMSLQCVVRCDSPY